MTDLLVVEDDTQLVKALALTLRSRGYGKQLLAEILKREGFIRDVEYLEDSKQGTLRVFLKYGASNERVITGLKRISKPGLRVYAKADEIPKVLGGLGIAIISTNQGVMTDKKARELNVGGEVLAFVW